MSDKLPPGRVIENDQNPSGPIASPPARSVLSRQAQRVIVCANDPLTIPHGLTGYTAAITADPGYSAWATFAIVSLLRDRGLRVVSWCDCDATPASAAIALCERLGLDGWIGQAETIDQYAHALGAGAQVIVANPNAWTDAQRRVATVMIEHDTLAVIGEMYRPDAGYSAQGVPIASFCYGIDIGGGVYTPLADYLAVSPPGSAATCCIYHAAGMRDADWALLR